MIKFNSSNWDTNQGYGETFITLNSGGWTEDSTCTPSACLNISSGVATPGESASTQSDASLFGIGGQYIFPTLIGQLITDSSADVTDLGILSDAKAEANTLLALTVDQTMQVALAEPTYVKSQASQSRLPRVGARFSAERRGLRLEWQWQPVPPPIQNGGWTALPTLRYCSL